MGCKFKNSRGWSLMEAAFLTVLASMFVSGGFALVQYTWTLRSLDEVVDRHIYDTAAKPFSLESDGGHVTVSIKNSELSSLVENVAETAFSALTQYFGSHSDGTAMPIFVEAVYAEAAIDPKSGRAAGLRKSPFTFQAARGDRTLTTTAGADRTLENEIALRAQKSELQLPGSGHSASEYAVPTGGFGAADGGDRFLPATIIIGARAAVSLEDTFTGSLLNLVGINPVVYSQKIVNLRGELG